MRCRRTCQLIRDLRVVNLDMAMFSAFAAKGMDIFNGIIRQKWMKVIKKMSIQTKSGHIQQKMSPHARPILFVFGISGLKTKTLFFRYKKFVF